MAGSPAVPSSDRRLEPEAAHLHAQHHHGRLRVRNALEHFVDTVVDSLQDDGRRGQHGHRLARRIHQVAREFEVDRA